MTIQNLDLKTEKNEKCRNYFLSVRYIGSTIGILFVNNKSLYIVSCRGVVQLCIQCLGFTGWFLQGGVM